MHRNASNSLFSFLFFCKIFTILEYLSRNLIATLVAADVGNIVLGGPYHGTRFQETGYKITLVPVALTIIIASADNVALVWIVLDSERTGDMATIHTVKLLTRNTMIKAGVPVIPGSKEAVYDVKEGAKIAKKIGYPVIIKAALGGGGKGMRVAQNPEEFEQSFQTARKEAGIAFGDETMYIEHFVKHPRHIEFQILADNYGNVIHLGERDCSIQRNHQKMIEESPSVALSAGLRKKMGEAAVRAAKAAGYRNAGTIEFLLEKSGAFYFMEMNTRIQVEHPVTEWVTGVDLIKEQIRIADGQKLGMKQKEVRISGHAIECRINAENPMKNFRPSPGTITDVHFPGGEGIRVDTAVYTGYQVPPCYDSMLAKLIVHGDSREEAIHKMKSALGEVIIKGVETNIDYQYSILNHPDFISGNIDVEFVTEAKGLLA